MPKTRPPYPAEFRQQIVELARAGRTPAELAREFGCSAQSITNWVGQAAIDEGKPLPGKDGLSSAERGLLAGMTPMMSPLATERPASQSRLKPESWISLVRGMYEVPYAVTNWIAQAAIDDGKPHCPARTA